MGEPLPAPNDGDAPDRARARAGRSVRCRYHRAVPGRQTCSECQARICQACAVPEQGDDPRVLCPSCAPGGAVVPSVPFERGGPSAWRDFWHTWRLCWGSWSTLFTAFPQQPIGRAVVFAFLATVPAALIGCAWQAVLVLTRHGDADPDLESLGISAGAQAAIEISLPLLGVLLAPVLAFFQAVVTHFPALLFGARWGFGTTFRIVCYSSALQVGWYIPMCGPLIWLVLQVLFTFHGMRRVQGLKTGPAVTVALAPYAACCGLWIGVVGFAAIMVFNIAARRGPTAVGVGGPGAPTTLGGPVSPGGPGGSSGEDDEGDEADEFDWDSDDEPPMDDDDG